MQTTHDATTASIRRLEDSGLFHALAGAGDGACAVASDRHILLWNPAAERLLGHTRDEAIGRTCCEVFQATAPRRACPHITAMDGSSGSVDVRIRRKSGEPIWLSVSTLTLPPENGEGPVTIHLFRRTTSVLHEAPAAAAPAVPTLPGAPEVAASADAAGSGPLTPRETEVLRLLASGANTKIAAQRLGVSPSTIRNHVQNMFMKLGVHSRLEAVAYARTHELL
jgi:PAS domain S-box-containing protein